MSIRQISPQARPFPGQIVRDGAGVRYKVLAAGMKYSRLKRLDTGEEGIALSKYLIPISQQEAQNAGQ